MVTLYISVESCSIFLFKNVDTTLICCWHFTTISQLLHRVLVDYWSIASWQSIEGLSKHVNTSLINYFSDSQATLQQNRIKLLESWWKFNKCLQVLWMVFLVSCLYNLLDKRPLQICMNPHVFVGTVVQQIEQIELFMSCICPATNHGRGNLSEHSSHWENWNIGRHYL